MRVYLVYSIEENVLHVEAVFTHLEELDKKYKLLGYTRKNKELFKGKERHYIIHVTELIGHISYTNTKPLYDERW